MISIKKSKIILLIYLFFVSIYLINSFNYDLKFQHDAQLHNYPIFHILNFNFDKIETPYGLIYYFFVSIFSIFSYPFYKLEIIDPRESFYLMIRISNFFLYTLSFLYTYKISKKIFKNNFFISILPTILIFSMAPVNRTFLMARPENLMILFVLISTYLLIKLLNNKNLNKKNYIVLLTSLIFVGSIKLNGFIFVLYFFTFLLFFYEKHIQIFKLSLLVFISIYIYYFIHNHISSMTVYDRPYNIDEAIELGKVGLFNLGKDLSFFLNFSFIDAWHNTYKYSQSDSMLNTLLLDLYGDYYGYGIFNYLKDNGGFTSKLQMCLIELNRASLILSAIFSSALILTSFYLLLNFKIILQKNSIILFLFGNFFTGILVLILLTINEYTENINSTYKWEYISFSLASIVYPIVYYLNKIIVRFNYNKILYLGLIIFIIASQFQMMPFRC